MGTTLNRPEAGGGRRSLAMRRRMSLGKDPLEYSIGPVRSKSYCRGKRRFTLLAAFCAKLRRPDRASRVSAFAPRKLRSTEPAAGRTPTSRAAILPKCKNEKWAWSHTVSTPQSVRADPVRPSGNTTERSTRRRLPAMGCLPSSVGSPSSPSSRRPVGAPRARRAVRLANREPCQPRR